MVNDPVVPSSFYIPLLNIIIIIGVAKSVALIEIYDLLIKII